jgi:hypothetical protein
LETIDDYLDDLHDIDVVGAEEEVEEVIKEWIEYDTVNA